MTHYTASSKPWVIVTRHPETNTDVEVVNGHVGVVVLDYGSIFDRQPDEAAVLADWIEGVKAQVENAPQEVKDIVQRAINAEIVALAFELQSTDDSALISEAKRVLDPHYSPESEDMEICGYPDDTGKVRPTAPDGSGDLWWDDASYITYQAMP